MVEPLKAKRHVEKKHGEPSSSWASLRCISISLRVSSAAEGSDNFGTGWLSRAHAIGWHLAPGLQSSYDGGWHCRSGSGPRSGTYRLLDVRLQWARGRANHEN